VMIFSNNLKSEKDAKKGEYFLKWAPGTFDPVDPHWPETPRAPAKVYVDKKLAEIAKK